MLAVTMRQPLAHRIALPETDGQALRVLNRPGGTPYRGPLAIHAAWRHPRAHLLAREWPGIVYGAVVALAELAAVVRVGVDGDLPRWAVEKYPRLLCDPITHRYLWVLERVRRLAAPVEIEVGRGGWWEVGREEAERVEMGAWGVTLASHP